MRKPKSEAMAALGSAAIAVPPWPLCNGGGFTHRHRCSRARLRHPGGDSARAAARLCATSSSCPSGHILRRVVVRAARAELPPLLGLGCPHTLKKICEDVPPQLDLGLLLAPWEGEALRLYLQSQRGSDSTYSPGPAPKGWSHCVASPNEAQRACSRASGSPRI